MWLWLRVFVSILFLLSGFPGSIFPRSCWLWLTAFIWEAIMEVHYTAGTGQRDWGEGDWFLPCKVETKAAVRTNWGDTSTTLRKMLAADSLCEGCCYCYPHFSGIIYSTYGFENIQTCQERPIHKTTHWERWWITIVHKRGCPDTVGGASMEESPPK